MIVLASSAVASLAVVHMVKRIGNRYTIIIASVLLGIALVVTPLVHSVAVLKAVQIANGLGRGILGTICMALSIQAVSSQHRATAMGIYQALYSIGMLAGPLLSGFIADSYGLSAVFFLSSSFCLIIIALAYLPILRR